MKAGANAVRVVGVAAGRDRAADLAPLRRLLRDWAEWSRGYRVRLGFPSSSLRGMRSESTDFDSLCDEVDATTNQSVDAAIDDLTPAQRAAVYRCYGLAAVFRFPRDNYEQMLDQAHEALLRSLPRRGVEVGC